jgi:Transposase DDE domain
MGKQQFCDAPIDCSERNRDALRSALGWICEAGIFDDLRFHGNTKWRPADLVALALSWVWSSQISLADAFTEAHKWSTKVFGQAALTTYQGLVGALATWTPTLMPLLWNRLQGLMEEVGGEHWRIGNWVAIAIDGSRGSVPRTRANEAAFCAKNFGHGMTAKYRKKKSKGMRRKRNRQAPPHPVKPQIWITLLWHMGLRLPWSWKLGPSDSSERQHVLRVLTEQQFPENTLFCGDAGFVGYDFWKAIVDSGHDFLVRVGGNVRLLRNLGYVRQRHGLVYCWSVAAMRKQQPPLVLRLLKFRHGRKYIYVATTVLSARRLSDRVAGELYRQRWGVEVQFRSLKQTFGRRKLRSHNPNRALVEMDWSLLGLCVIQLWAVQEQIRAGLLPERLSVAQAVRIVRQCFDDLSERPAPGKDLRSLFRQAVLDDYERSSNKEARYKPKYYTKPSVGKPVVSLAKSKHKIALQKYFQQLAA